MRRDELVKALYRGLILDICTAYPGDTRSLQRDLHRLEVNVDRLGHYFYSLDMPRICASFRLAMEYGHIGKLYGVNHCKLLRGTCYPLLFNSLWARVFDRSGDIKSDPDTTAIFFLHELLLVFKKIDGSCDESTDKEVVDEFFKQESQLRIPSLNWNVDEFSPDRDLHLRDGDCGRCDDLTDELFPSNGNALVDPRLAETAQRVADTVFASFSRFDPEREQCRHGPGAVSDMARGDDKYRFRHWPERLDRLFAYDAHGTIGLAEPASFVDHEHPAKLICVPKDARGPRLIASEPSYLQFAQQNINAFLRKEIGNSCIGPAIRFTDQSFSQEWAISSSIDKSHATVDLKSASDLLSLWAIERILRKSPSLLSAIYHTRSRYLTDGSNTIFIRKVAPMGNAYIFPLQTAVYTILSIAALYVIDGRDRVTLKGIRKYAREVRVFGDDIIIPRRAYGCLVSLLSIVGLQVNTSKSFSEGNFREACGIDAYSGSDVTPVYVKAVPSSESPESVVSTVECVNNLRRRGLYNMSMALRSLIPRMYAKHIPEVVRGSGAFGFQVSLPGPFQGRSRYNRDLQRMEFKTIAPVSEVRVKKPEGIRNLLQHITESPSQVQNWESGIKIPRDLKLRSRWVPYLEICF